MLPPALAHLAKISAEYAEMAQAYEEVARTAAECEADHRHARAKAVLKYKASEDRMSQAEAETRAEADDGVANLYRLRVVTAAVADAHRERLRQLREQTSVGRSVVASERAGDEIHAHSGTP